MDAVPDVMHARNRHNALKRYRGADHPDTRAAAGDLLAARIKALVDAAPELAPEQHRRLSALLAPPTRQSGRAA